MSHQGGKQIPEALKALGDIYKLANMQMERADAAEAEVSRLTARLKKAGLTVEDHEPTLDDGTEENMPWQDAELDRGTEG